MQCIVGSKLFQQGDVSAEVGDSSLFSMAWWCKGVFMDKISQLLVDNEALQCIELMAYLRSVCVSVFVHG